MADISLNAVSKDQEFPLKQLETVTLPSPLVTPSSCPQQLVKEPGSSNTKAAPSVKHRPFYGKERSSNGSFNINPPHATKFRQ